MPKPLIACLVATSWSARSLALYAMHKVGWGEGGHVDTYWCEGGRERFGRVHACSRLQVVELIDTDGLVAAAPAAGPNADASYRPTTGAVTDHHTAQSNRV